MSLAEKPCHALQKAFPGHVDGLVLVNILAMKVGGPQAEAFGDQDRTSSEDRSETCCE